MHWLCDYCESLHGEAPPTQETVAFQVPTLVDGKTYCDALCASATGEEEEGKKS